MNGCKTVQLEICCGDVASVMAAREGGAGRIELCSGLTDGGLTPSVGLIESAVAIGIEEINVLIRPRPYDFRYSAPEVAVMCKDIAAAVRAGATGVVIGALTAAGDVDLEMCRRLVDTARATAGRKVNVTFHRAFDLARDADRAVDDIMALGCDCLLTSGMAAAAECGMAVLARLTGRCGSHLTIMAGGGITPDNAARIIRETGVGAIHATARSSAPSGMTFRRAGVPMGAPGMDEYTIRQTDPQIVGRLLHITKTTTTCAKQSSQPLS